ncbi:MAG: hypothetical protein WBW88_02645 [Rhodothermales bacterium]
MKHALSSDDRRFRTEFEKCTFSPERFNHRAHIRLAYVYLVEHDTETALASMRKALLAFLKHHRIDPAKYHETMTRAWILAVRHFMEKAPAALSADLFIDGNPTLLNSKIMLSHYSAALLFSQEARQQFVGPDLEPIPRHEP